MVIWSFTFLHSQSTSVGKIDTQPSGKVLRELKKSRTFAQSKHQALIKLGVFAKRSQSIL